MPCVTYLRETATPERPLALPQPINALTHHSSAREKTFEHLALAHIGLELMARRVEFEVLHAEVDRDGYDIVIEAGGIMRHIQLKVKIVGGARSEITVNTRLAAKPSGCIVWLSFDPATRDFDSVHWFGGKPGAPLPDCGDKVAKHTRANSTGMKNERSGHRVLGIRQFEKLSGITHLVDRLFGRLQMDPLTFLRSRFNFDPTAGGWSHAVAQGSFRAIPEDFAWETAIGLTRLVDGYALLELISDETPPEFYARQSKAQELMGSWQGDAITLLVTLFLEVRADHFGMWSLGAPEKLDQLCRQLRTALVELEEAADA